MECVVNK